jgi:hypothetical protein
MIFVIQKKYNKYFALESMPALPTGREASGRLDPSNP